MTAKFSSFLIAGLVFAPIAWAAMHQAAQIYA